MFFSPIFKGNSKLYPSSEPDEPTNKYLFLTEVRGRGLLFSFAGLFRLRWAVFFIEADSV